MVLGSDRQVRVLQPRKSQVDTDDGVVLAIGENAAAKMFESENHDVGDASGQLRDRAVALHALQGQIAGGAKIAHENVRVVGGVNLQGVALLGSLRWCFGEGKIAAVPNLDQTSGLNVRVEQSHELARPVTGVDFRLRHFREPNAE